MQHYPPRGRVRLNIEHLPWLLHAAYQRRVYEAEEYLLSMWASEVSKCTGLGAGSVLKSLQNLCWKSVKLCDTKDWIYILWRPLSLKRTKLACEWICLICCLLSVHCVICEQTVNRCIPRTKQFFYINGLLWRIETAPCPLWPWPSDMWESSNAR